MLCGKLGQAQSIEYRIETDNIPIYVEPYRSIIAEKPIVEEHVKKMLDSVVITDSRSPYNAPLLMVPKKDGEKRFCINYRKLNAATLKDRFPIPRINETLTALHGARYFTTLDIGRILANPCLRTSSTQNSLHGERQTLRVQPNAVWPM